MRKKKVLICIDHDITIRHFIKSNIFSELDKKNEVIYAFNIDDSTNKKWINTDVNAFGLDNVYINKIPRKRMGSWHRLYAITVLHNQRGKKNYKGRRQRLCEIDGKLRTFFHEFMSLPLIYRFSKKYYLKKQGIYNDFYKFIKEISPDIILYPSILTGYYMNELLLTKDKLKIPLIILMNSWDNPSQKAVVTGKPDKLIVWGEQSKKHAVEYLGLKDENIEVFGAAQFQIYRSKVKESRNALCKLFNVPDDKQIILYAGVSKSINEIKHLVILEDAIERKIIKNCHILYRPHPWRGCLVDSEEDFFLKKFKHVSMDPHMEAYYKRIVKEIDNSFQLSDYSVTGKLLNLVSGTISSLSTIQLETIMHGKPTISFMTKFDLETKYGKSAAVSYKLVHFSDLWDCPGVIICQDKKGLLEGVKSLLKISTDAKKTEEIKKHSSHFILNEGEDYSTRLCSLIDSYEVLK